MLPALTAERQLARIEAASVPHMKPHAAREVVRGYVRELGRSQRSKPATTADLAAMGIRVEEVPGV